MAELTLEESIQQILPTLPLPIQKFFQQGKLSETVQLLTERYAFHIDQGTILERELMFLLLGLKDPDEFATALYEQLPISKQTVQDIIADIDKEVFVPLREEEKKSGGMKTDQPAKPAAAPQAPRENFTIPPQRNVIIPANPRMPGRPAETETLGEEWLRKPQVNASVPRYIPPRPVITTTPMPKADEKLLEDREEPHIEFNPSSLQPSPKATADTVEATKGAAKTPARTAPPPPNLPGIMLPPGETLEIPSSPTVPKIETPAPSVQSKPISPIAPSISVPSKPYSTDPYREPIDEEGNRW